MSVRHEVLDYLCEITPEEASILQGEPLDMSNYIREGSFIVDPGKMLPDGKLFGIRTHTRFVDFPNHGHGFVEMVYQVQGKTEHMINGTESLTLQEGHILLLGRGTEHSIKAASEKDLAINLFLIPSFFDNAAISIGGDSNLAIFLMGNLKNRRLQSDYIVFNVKSAPMIENLLENLIMGQLERVNIHIQQLTLEVLLWHLSTMSEKMVVKTYENQNNAVVLTVLSQIENQVRVNLSEIAESMGVNVTTLSRLIQRQTGCTFTELLHTARFNRAINLLRDTELSIVDIVTSIGYENTAFFYRRFSKRYGCTPLEYRKRYREKL